MTIELYCTETNASLQVLVMVSDVKGPKKMFPDLPFGNADSDKVEARKSQLDAFLKVGIGIMTSVEK